MKLHVLKSVEAKLRGVIGRDMIQEDEVFIFPDTYEGAGFHMNGVPFNISIAFLDRDYGILDIQEMVADRGSAIAPHQSVLAVEAQQGYFERKGLRAGDVWSDLWTRAQQGEL